ncbi:MAG TPA: hypothetical protein VGK82_17045 [Pyrinomonadaceae bacterium]
MVDDEVVEILAEIKRRVSAGQEKPLSEGVAETPRAFENPGPSSISPPLPPSRLNGYAGLPVMARAWDRLPPVVSNRTGTLARLELWIKEKFRAAFRWFTWEQVNFNAATHQTLLEVVEALNRYEQHLAELRENLDAEREELKQLASTLPSLTTQIEQVDRKQLAHIAKLNARLEGLSQLAKDQHAETHARLAEFTAESRVRDQELSDEQRVCYKQLSLELSESRVLEDRARRELEARLDKLEK